MAINFTLYQNTNAGNRLDGNYPNGDAPALSDVTNVTFDASTITVDGGGFGTKTQAAPVLAVFGSEIWENGVASTAEEGLAQDAAIVSGTTWDLAQNVTVDKTDLRAGLVDQMYRGRGDIAGEGMVGWPNVFLSTNGDRSSSYYNEKLYVSFYAKFSASPFYYRAVVVSGGDPENFQTGVDEFDEGEAISFDGLTGKVLHYDSVGGILHLKADTSAGSNNFDNKVITGLVSGATTTAQSLPVGTNYSNPSATKILRVYENTSSTGPSIRTGFSPTGISIGNYDGNSEIIELRYPAGGASMRPSSWTDWHQVRFWMDNSGETGDGYIVQGDDSFTWSGFSLQQKSPTNGLVPSNIGFDLSGVNHDIHIKQWFGEIYADTTLQKVVVGDNSDFSLCTKLDPLVANTWSNTQIVLKKRNLSGWLFVVDDNDQPVNSTGYAVTIS